jgi:hypothetical protein
MSNTTVHYELADATDPLVRALFEDAPLLFHVARHPVKVQVHREWAANNYAGGLRAFSAELRHRLDIGEIIQWQLAANTHTANELKVVCAQIATHRGRDKFIQACGDPDRTHCMMRTDSLMPPAGALGNQDQLEEWIVKTHPQGDQRYWYEVDRKRELGKRLLQLVEGPDAVGRERKELIYQHVGAYRYAMPVQDLVCQTVTEYLALGKALTCDALKRAARTTLPEPHFEVNLDDRREFLLHRPSRGGPLTRELSRRADFIDSGAPELDKDSVLYEYKWGIVREQSGHWGVIWNFYIPAIWRTGTTAYYDAMISGWHNDCEDSARAFAKRNGGGFHITVRDGIGNFSCLEVGCLFDSIKQELVRQWIVKTLIPRKLPLMVAKALDPHWRYKTAWTCL